MLFHVPGSAVDRHGPTVCEQQNHRFEFRPLLRAGISDSDLQDAVQHAITLKPERHEFIEKPLQVVRFMAKTGG